MRVVKLVFYYLCVRALSYPCGRWRGLSRGGFTAGKMFTGIVEEMGTVDSLELNPRMLLWDGSLGEGVELTVMGAKTVQEGYLGCSIAVNGVCLTATSIEGNKFTVGLAPETLRRTNLGKLQPGARVNLERALRADGRNSGHFVQGHVDCCGTILSKWKENDSLWFKVQLPQDYIRYVVPKGFICVDGTSLTVCAVESSSDVSWFTFMLIAHTQQSVIIPLKGEGDLVNIEVDVLAKMVETSVAGFTNRKVQDDVERLEKQVLLLSATTTKLIERLQILEQQIIDILPKR